MREGIYYTYVGTPARWLTLKIPEPLYAVVIKELRKFRRRRRRYPNAGPTARIKENRKALGKQISQWRKEYGQTEGISRSAPRILVVAEEEVSALR